jgi:hypothetical protein
MKNGAGARQRAAIAGEQDKTVRQVGWIRYRSMEGPAAERGEPEGALRRLVLC